MVGVSLSCQLHTDCIVSLSHFNISGFSWSCQSLCHIYPTLSAAEVSTSLHCVIRMHATSSVNHSDCYSFYKLWVALFHNR